MIITIFSAIAMTYSSIKFFNDDYFYQLETEQRMYKECNFEYMGKTLIDKKTKQFLPFIDDNNKYIYWKHVCK